MPVLGGLPAPSPRGGGRSSAAVPGARSRRRPLGARGSSRARRPRPAGGGPGKEGGAAPLCTCHRRPGEARRPRTDPTPAAARGARAVLTLHRSRVGGTHSPRGALLPARPAAARPPRSRRPPRLPQLAPRLQPLRQSIARLSSGIPKGQQPTVQ